MRSLDGYLLCACTASRRGGGSGDDSAAGVGPATSLSRADAGGRLLVELEPTADALAEALADVR